MIYLISDTHFGQDTKGLKLIFERPFNQKENIEELIKRWNIVVKDDDEVYHLGDVFTGLDDKERKEIISKLKRA